MKCMFSWLNLIGHIRAYIYNNYINFGFSLCCDLACLLFVSVELYRCRFAAQRRDGNDYFILLIITDGIITDMPQTCEAIVNVSPLLLQISWIKAPHNLSTPSVHCINTIFIMIFKNKFQVFWIMHVYDYLLWRIMNEVWYQKFLGYFQYL